MMFVMFDAPLFGEVIQQFRWVSLKLAENAPIPDDKNQK